MEQFVKIVGRVNEVLNNFVWGPVMLAFFLLVGLMFTIRTNFFQFTQFKSWMDVTLLQLLKNKKVRKTEDKHSISQFQALCTALAATIGTGNIAGVATAIVFGGPGAIFWMWVSAFLGMMTNFAENVLGIKYRYKNEKGFWVGGAMVYIERGLHMKWLAVFFSVFCALASFGIGNMTQANSIAGGLYSSFGVPKEVTAVVCMLLVAVVLVGGIKRIAVVTEKFVPFMALFYIAGGLMVILANVEKIPMVFEMIFREALQLRAGAGGIAGYGMASAMKYGISRGVFSNEAGLGSSVMAHSASDVKEPVVQGMWGIFTVFADTIVSCSVTAFVILLTDVYDVSRYIEDMAVGKEVISGTTLTANAFGTVIPHGDKFIALAIMMFAFSTILGWSYYGECAVEYLFGNKAILPYKIIYVGAICVGCLASLELVWSIADTLNGLMAIPNLIAVTLLSNQVVETAESYLTAKKKQSKCQT